jgi:hypothetical protein
VVSPPTSTSTVGASGPEPPPPPPAPGGPEFEVGTRDRLERLGRTGAVAEHVEIERLGAAVELQVEPGAADGTARRGAGEQRILGGDLLAHDHDLFPLAGGRLADRPVQLARRLQEFVAIAPDEEHLGQLQLEVAALRLARCGEPHQVRRLVVESVGHVEIGLGQRIALVEVDAGLAAERVVRGDGVGGRGAAAAGEARLLVLARLLDHEAAALDWAREVRTTQPRRVAAGRRRHRHLAGGGRGAAEVVLDLGGPVLLPAAIAEEARGQCRQADEHPPELQHGIEQRADQ